MHACMHACMHALCEPCTAVCVQELASRDSLCDSLLCCCAHTLHARTLRTHAASWSANARMRGGVHHSEFVRVDRQDPLVRSRDSHPAA